MHVRSEPEIYKIISLTNNEGDISLFGLANKLAYYPRNLDCP